MPRSVFISHSSTDASSARRICEGLESRGLSCWIAPRDIPLGETYGSAIIEGVRESDVFLIVVSDAAGNSKQVEREVERAAHHDKPIVPVIITKNEPTRRLEYYLAGRQWLDCSSGIVDCSLDILVQGIQNMLPGGPPVSGPERAVAEFGLRTQQPRPSTPADGHPRLARRVLSPARIAALPALVVAIAWLWSFTIAPLGAIESIAVLPFENVTGDAGLEYLSDGIPDRVVTTLARIPKLRVISSTSVQRFKHVRADPRELARELNVRAVLVGRLLKTSEHVSIQVELVDTENNAPLWAERYDGRLVNIVDVEEKIARGVRENLGLRLTSAVQQQLDRRPPRNPEPYRKYLEGRFYWNKRTPDGLERAVKAFSEASLQDPSYGEAFAGLADAYGLLGYYRARPTSEAYSLGRAAAQRALELDDSLAEAHVSLGLILAFHNWNWSAAEAELRRAIELNPSYGTAYQFYAGVLLIQGRFDNAVAELRKAIEVDPLSLPINTVLGSALIASRNYGAGFLQLRQTLEKFPGTVMTQEELAWGYWYQGRRAEALREAATLASIGGDREARLLRFLERLAAGDSAGASVLLDEWPGISAWDTAFFHAAAGNKVQALEALRACIDAGETGVVMVRAVPVFDLLRAEPEYKALLMRLNLTP